MTYYLADPKGKTTLSLELQATNNNEQATRDGVYLRSECEDHPDNVVFAAAREEHRESKVLRRIRACGERTLKHLAAGNLTEARRAARQQIEACRTARRIIRKAIDEHSRLWHKEMERKHGRRPSLPVFESQMTKMFGR